MEAFKKIPSSFGVVVRKPGLGVNYPPPTCNTRVKRPDKFCAYCMQLILILHASSYFSYYSGLQSFSLVHDWRVATLSHIHRAFPAIILRYYVHRLD